MVRDSVQLETAVNTITHEYLLEFTSEYGISEMLRPELPGPGDRIVDFPEGKVGVYTGFFEFANFRLPLSQFLFDVLEHSSHPEPVPRVLYSVIQLKVDECVFPPVVEWRTNASKDGMPASDEPAAATDSSGNVSSPTEVGSPGSVYRPEWGITNGSLLDTPEACQDLVDHVAPPGYFFELRHMHNEDFLWQYNINLARQVAMGSQLRLGFEQEAKLLRKSVAQVARREQRIQARESEIKNLEV
nr:putative transposase (putative), gypsy type [Tanacetum cinerariifolium]